MAIDIYISTNGKANPYSQVQQQNQAQQTEANDGTISQEQQAHRKETPQESLE